MKKIRINVLARELEVKAHELLDKLPELGVTEKKTHSSSIDDDVAEKLRRVFRRQRRSRRNGPNSPRSNGAAHGDGRSAKCRARACGNSRSARRSCTRKPQPAPPTAVEEKLPPANRRPQPQRLRPPLADLIA